MLLIYIYNVVYSRGKGSCEEPDDGSGLSQPSSNYDLMALFYTFLKLCQYAIVLHQPIGTQRSCVVVRLWPIKHELLLFSPSKNFQS